MRLPGGRRLMWHGALGREPGLIFWAMIGLEAAFSVYVSIWPLWIAALGAPVTVVGLILGASGVLRLLALAPSAALADRIAPRTLMVAARATTGVGFVTAAMATHWTQLAPMVVCGAIGDMAVPLMQSHLAQHAGAQRVRAFALVFNIGPAIAFGLSPLIAGPLIAQFGMRAAFLYAAVCTVFSIVFLSRLAPAPRQSAPQESSRRSYRVALAEPAIPLLLILQFATIFALAAGILLMPLFLAEARGISPALIAILGGIGSIGAVLFGLAVARSEWLQRRPLTAITIGIAMVLGTLAVVLATHVVWLIALAFVGRGGLWSTWSLYAGAMGEVVRRERVRTRVFALSEMIGGTAYATAPVLSGQLYAIGPEIPLVASLAASAALIPVLLVAQRRLLPDRPHLGAAKAPVAVTALIDSEAV